jgi:hypothetical protein
LFVVAEGDKTMVILECVDGEVADDEALEARCLCDMRASFVWTMELSYRRFNRAAAALADRRAARSAFVAARMGDAGRFGVIDADMAFALNDEFEESHGRDPLEALVNDVEEIMHRELGGYFAIARPLGVVTSPMSAGAALKVAAARSFRSAEDLEDHRRGVSGGWRPSVRADVSFVIAGEISKVSAAASTFGSLMAARGPLVGLTQSVRRVDTAGVPHILPLLAPMALVANLSDDRK